MRLHVVNHTHWDREWYRPYEAFRARLVELVEQVCDALDTGRARRFHLDGQTVTAVDVEEVRPDLAARVAEHVAAGRMSIGPWHVLADNQLVSGESLIRNLLAARRHAARFGGLSRVGYCPDAFGHPADLPRVLRGFGIDTALVWRGAPAEHARFRWRSPDGAEVLAVNQRYYEPDVLWDAGSAAERIAAYLERQRERDPEGPWLLLNGADHLAPRLTTALPADGPVVESGLADYVAELAADPGSLPLVEGELRYPGDWLTFLLPGTLSSRIHLKQANAAAQALLERWVEPFTVLAGRGAATAGLLRHAWELLLSNAPHDSICGCSVDEVHRENEVRYARVAQLGEHLLQRSLLDLGLDTRLAGPPPVDEAELAVVNPHPFPATGGVEVELRTAPGRRVVDLYGPDGRTVPVEVTPLGPAPLFCADVDIPPDTQDSERHRLAFVARDVPPTGWARYRVRLAGADREPAAAPVATPGRTAERDGWRVTVGDDASLTLTTPGGRTLTGLGRLVDGGDAGDTYTYDPPAEDRLVTPRLCQATVVESPARTVVEIVATLDLPLGLTADRAARSPESVSTPLRITATVWSGAAELDWRVEFDNPAGDHRLRAHFPGDTADTWLADCHFSVASRPLTDPLGPLPERPGYESEAGVAPVQSWAALPGVGVIAPGLPEVQGLRPRPGADRPELAVTLLRAVGWLSRPDLRARTAGAGPQLATPQAQCRRTLRAGIGIRPGEPDLGALARAAVLRQAPLHAWQLRPGTPAPAPSVGHLAVAGAEVTAYKPAEDGGGAVLRLLNRTPGAATARVTGIAGRLAECTFAEEPTGEVLAPGAPIELGPWQTRSFRVP